MQVAAHHLLVMDVEEKYAGGGKTASGGDDAGNKSGKPPPSNYFVIMRGNFSDCVRQGLLRRSWWKVNIVPAQAHSLLVGSDCVL